MITKTHIRYILAAVMFFAMAATATSCIEDGISDSPADQPVFSVDTLHIGTVFTDEVTTTHRFVVRNPGSKGINISSISLSGDHAPLFRLNVDGFSGTSFNNVEIRAKDSIFVFVEATLPPNAADLPVEICANVDFVTNGINKKVTVSAVGQDVERLRAHTVTGDVTFDSGKPYQIFDSLVVAENSTLRLPAGARLCFHDGATMIVRGRLLASGTVEKPVELMGDRTGNVITNVTFDLMSRQWNGLQFTVSSNGNVMENTIVRNTWYGVILSGDGTDNDNPKIRMLNCRLRNSGDMVLEAYDASVEAVGCEFAEAANGLVRLSGGTHSFTHCTFANYYLFSAIGGAALQLTHLDEKTDAGTGTPFTKALIANSILYGLGSDVTPGSLDGTDVFLRHCLLKSNGSDDNNFTNCLWNSDPLYYTVREEYYFDYRLRNNSPAIGAANPDYTPAKAAVDGYGMPRGNNPDLGAYVHTEP